MNNIENPEPIVATKEWIADLQKEVDTIRTDARIQEIDEELQYKLKKHLV